MSITCVTTTLAPCVPAGNTTRLFVPVPYCRLMMYCSLHLYIRVNSLKTAPPETEAEWKAGLICRLWKEELCRGTFTVLRVNQETAYPYFLQGSSVQRRGHCARIKRAVLYLCKDQPCNCVLLHSQQCYGVLFVQWSIMQWGTPCANIVSAMVYSLCKHQRCSGVLDRRRSAVQWHTPVLFRERAENVFGIRHLNYVAFRGDCVEEMCMLREQLDSLASEKGFIGNRQNSELEQFRSVVSSKAVPRTIEKRIKDTFLDVLKKQHFQLKQNLHWKDDIWINSRAWTSRGKMVMHGIVERKKWSCMGYWREKKWSCMG